MTRYFLGVDVGGTKTHALIADEAGRVVGFGSGGPGNPNSETYTGMMERAIGPAVAGALATAQVTRDQIAGVGYGIAGYDWPSERELNLTVLDQLGLTAPREIVNDAVVGLLAGAEHGWGVAVVAGTGCNCRGWDQHHREGRVTGEGEFGEWAGGGDVVTRAVQAVSREWSRRGPPTRLTPALISKVGARDSMDFLEGLFLRRYQLDSSAAPLVFQVAAEGDVIARRIITWAGEELANLAVGVIRQLNFENLTFDVILVGSLWKGGPMLLDPMRGAVHEVAPGARFVRLATPPVVGGVLLGMEMGGLEPYGLRQRLIETTHQFLQDNGG